MGGSVSVGHYSRSLDDHSLEHQDAPPAGAVRVGGRTVRLIVCRSVLWCFDPRTCPPLLKACASPVRPCLCQRATYTGNPHIGRNRRWGNRRPHRAATHGVDYIVDSGFGLTPCCTRLGSNGRALVHPRIVRDGSLVRRQEQEEPAHRARMAEPSVHTTHTVCRESGCLETVTTTGQKCDGWFVGFQT